MDEIDLSDIYYSKSKADLPMRGVCAQYSAHGVGKDYDLNVPFLDWLCKNRYNYIYTWNSVYEHFKENGMLEESLKRGIIFMVGHHDSIDTLLPQRGNKYFSEHYFETHPEYYKLTEDGKRFEMVDNWGQMVLCSKNDEMVNQLADNSPNIYVKEATWHISGLRKVGKSDGSCISGTFYEENLLKWRNLGVSVMYYDYLMGVYPGRQRYVPMACEMQAFCRRFIEKGIDGIISQFDVYNHWNNNFNYYTYGRTSYDCEKSIDDNLELFCRIFGEGGKFVADNIKYAETILDGQCEIMTAGIYLMNHIDKEKVYAGYEKALSAAKTPAARNNDNLPNSFCT